MKSRFDLEDKIHDAWQTSKDIEAIFSHLCEERIKANDAENALMGLKVLHDIRMQEVWDTFKQVFQVDEYRPQTGVEFP